MEIGKKIRQLRTQKKYTLKELAEKTGLSISFISDIENNRRKPSIENLDKLAQALNVNTSFLSNLTKDEINQIESDPDIRAIARAAQKMSPEQRKDLARFLKKAFDKAFEDNE